MIKSFGSIFLLLIASMFSCVSHDLDRAVGPPETDQTFFSEIQNTAGYHYYEDGVILEPAPASPHSRFKLRFNEIAWSALDENGELPVAGEFPEGSVIVKEVHASGSLGLYAVIKKRSADTNAAEGWLWAEYRPDGTLGYSVGQKGLGCTGCHSSGTHRDFVRTFDLH